jgi:hypothetical protein
MDRRKEVMLIVRETRKEYKILMGTSEGKEAAVQFNIWSRLQAGRLGNRSIPGRGTRFFLQSGNFNFYTLKEGAT